MALTISNAGTGSSNTSTTTLTVTGVTAAVGDWLVVICAADNNGTSGAASLTTSMSDSAGNTYTNRGGLINHDPGVAAAGATLGMWTCNVTSALSSATLTLNFSPATVAKAAIVYKVVPQSGFTVAFDRVGAGATSTTTTKTITASNVIHNRTIFGGVALESSAAITSDSDTTDGSWSTAYTQTSGGTMEVSGQWKTVTGTGNQTFNISMAASTDGAINWLTLYEARKSVPVFRRAPRFWKGPF